MSITFDTNASSSDCNWGVVVASTTVSAVCLPSNAETVAGRFNIPSSASRASSFLHSSANSPRCSFEFTDDLIVACNRMMVFLHSTIAVSFSTATVVCVGAGVVCGVGSGATTGLAVTSVGDDGVVVAFGVST